MARWGYVIAGWLSVALGVIGIFLPIMPTTVFLIAAAFLFGRGSPRARRWLLDHRWFGPPIRRWEETGAIPPSGKVAACVAMAASLGIAWFFGVPPWAFLIQAGCIAAVTVFILTRPS